MIWLGCGTHSAQSGRMALSIANFRDYDVNDGVDEHDFSTELILFINTII
jgi:hypothetical protein